MERGSQKTGKQLVFFRDKEEFDVCNDDVIKILLPVGKYCAHNLNFLNCFLNNTPPKEQQFILHWSRNRVPRKAFMQDVLEIITVQLTKDGGEREVHYLIPVPVLFEILGISLSKLPHDMLVDETYPRDPWESCEDAAMEREAAYNKVFGAYCQENGITFHCIQRRVKRNRAYMKQMQIL